MWDCVKGVLWGYLFGVCKAEQLNPPLVPGVDGQGPARKHGHPPIVMTGKVLERGGCQGRGSTPNSQKLSYHHTVVSCPDIANFVMFGFNMYHSSSVHQLSTQCPSSCKILKQCR